MATTYTIARRKGHNDNGDATTHVVLEPSGAVARYVKSEASARIIADRMTAEAARDADNTRARRERMAKYPIHGDSPWTWRTRAYRESPMTRDARIRDEQDHHAAAFGRRSIGCWTIDARAYRVGSVAILAALATVATSEAARWIERVKAIEHGYCAYSGEDFDVLSGALDCARKAGAPVACEWRS